MNLITILITAIITSILWAAYIKFFQKKDNSEEIENLRLKEEELKDNNWLVIPADSAVLFNTDCARRAQAAALSIGLNLDMLALESGHA